MRPAAVKKVRVKLLPHVTFWKETPLKEEERFHFEDFSCGSPSFFLRRAYYPQQGNPNIVMRGRRVLQKPVGLKH